MFLLLIWPGSFLVPAPQEDRLSLVYPWGDTYLNVTHELVSRKISLIEEIEGDSLRFRNGELEVRYLFYTKEKIGDIILMQREEEGEQRMVLDRLILETAYPREEAPLYAVDVLFPGLPLDTEEHAETEKEIENKTETESLTLLARLEEIYGKSSRKTARDRLSPAQSEKTRRERARQNSQAIRVAGSLEFGNRDTLVRVYYEEQSGRRFARRMSLVSREISRSRNKDIENIKKSADRLIRKKIRVVNRELRREARSQK